MFRYGNDMPKHITTQTPINHLLATTADDDGHHRHNNGPALLGMLWWRILGAGGVAPAEVSGQRPDRTGDLFCEHKKGRKCGTPCISLHCYAHHSMVA
jgi:hypothetical protein